MAGSLTRRQLLVRTGGVSVAFACFGALPHGAAADAAPLSSARAAAFAAVLDAINTDPGYELADRAHRAERFAELYRAADDPFRAYADAVLDELAQRGVGHVAPAAARERLSADALELASLPYIDPDAYSHTIVFSL